jgi:hypothetical protein
MRNTVLNIHDTLTATIANGQSLSGALNLGGLRLFGIVMPAAWTAAGLTFRMSPDGGASWSDLYDDAGVEFIVSAAASRFIMLDPAGFSALPWLQARSGTSVAPVAQGADRSLTLMLRSI